MKRLLLTAFVLLVLCGSAFAQSYESHWADFDPQHINPYENHFDIIAFVQIDDEFVTFDDNWAALEVAAFVGDTCRGHYFLEQHQEDQGAPRPTVAMFIFCNTPNEPLTFKMYDHANEIEYDICANNYLQDDGTLIPMEIVTGVSNYDQWDFGAWGVTLSFTTPPTPLTQTVMLHAGSNWFSTYLEMELEELQNALVAAMSEPDSCTIVIKSKEGNCRWTGSRWRENGFEWDVAKMYRIEVTEDCEFTLTGMLIDPAQHPITILAGEATWIGFPFAESMEPADVIPAGFAVNGDQIKYKNGNARYTSNGWRASGLTELEPGLGYMYIPASTVTEDRILIYPTNAK